MPGAEVRKTLALCADDYGLSAAVNAGVLRLAQAGRLTEVSCLVNGAAWTAGAPALVKLRDKSGGRLRVGLHFNLTEGAPLSPALQRLWPRLPALSTLITQAHLGRLPLAALGEELNAQLQAFEHATRRIPVHLDGHQHVHHLPGVRDLVLALLPQRPGLLVRDTGRVRGAGHAVKRLLIEGTGGTALRAALRAVKRQANSELRGVYDFQRADYRGLMQRWLAGLPPEGTLIFCHPGEAATAPADDAIAGARVRELAYLDSAEFAQDLAAAGVRLGAAA
jgi:predicted glycoside hydrolase/deacetylase ChbG (UPF0249 family)